MSNIAVNEKNKMVKYIVFKKAEKYEPATCIFLFTSKRNFLSSEPCRKLEIGTDCLTSGKTCKYALAVGNGRKLKKDFIKCLF